MLDKRADANTDSILANGATSGMCASNMLSGRGNLTIFEMFDVPMLNWLLDNRIPTLFGCAYSQNKAAFRLVNLRARRGLTPN